MRKSIIRAIATQARLALSALSKKEDLPNNFKRAYYLLLPEHEYARKALVSIIDMLDRGGIIYRIPKEVLCQYDNLSMDEAAVYMGVGIGTVREWVKEKQIRPVEQQGRLMFFSRKDLDEFIAKKR